MSGDSSNSRTFTFSVVAKGWLALVLLIIVILECWRTLRTSETYHSMGFYTFCRRHFKLLSKYSVYDCDQKVKLVSSLQMTLFQELEAFLDDVWYVANILFCSNGAVKATRPATSCLWVLKKSHHHTFQQPVSVFSLLHSLFFFFFMFFFFFFF